MAFKPKKKIPTTPNSLSVRIGEEELVKIQKLANAYGLSTAEFARKAMLYALDHMDGE